MSCYVCGLTCANFIPSISFAPDWKRSWPVQHEREEQSDLPSPVLLLPATCLHTQLQLVQGNTADGLVWYDALFQNVLDMFGIVWMTFVPTRSHGYEPPPAGGVERNGAGPLCWAVIAQEQEAMPLDFRGVGSGGGMWACWDLVLECFRMF